jgi:hypothetical protein
LNVDSFSSAFFLVSALIQSRPSIVCPMAVRMFLTISCMRALAAGEKCLATYF